MNKIVQIMEIVLMDNVIVLKDIKAKFVNKKLNVNKIVIKMEFAYMAFVFVNKVIQVMIVLN